MSLMREEAYFVGTFCFLTEGREINILLRCVSTGKAWVAIYNIIFGFDIFYIFGLKLFTY